MVAIPAGDGGFGLGPLRIVQREDRAAILGADITALTVQLRRIMGAQKHVEQIGVGQLIGVKGHPHRLGMAGGAAAHFLIRRVGFGPADIAAFDRAHADHIVHHRLGAPEAPTCNDCLFLRHNRSVSVDCRAQIGIADALVIGGRPGLQPRR